MSIRGVSPSRDGVCIVVSDTDRAEVTKPMASDKDMLFVLNPLIEVIISPWNRFTSLAALPGATREITKSPFSTVSSKKPKLVDIEGRSRQISTKSPCNGEVLLRLLCGVMERFLGDSRLFIGVGVTDSMDMRRAILCARAACAMQYKSSVYILA